MSKNTNIIAVVLVFALFIGVMLGLLFSEKTFKTTVIFTGKSDSLPNATEATTNKININTADAEDLALLPGIGPSLAENIIAYRKTHGPFISLEDLSKVDGIGKKKLEAIIKYITIGG